MNDNLATNLFMSSGLFLEQYPEGGFKMFDRHHKSGQNKDVCWLFFIPCFLCGRNVGLYITLMYLDGHIW